LGSRPEFIAFLKRLLTEADKFEAMGAGASIETVAPTGSLTRKELEVLQLLAEGYSNQRLSDELGVSETTVRTHLRNINAKLDVASRMEAVARARQIGLLG
jgi:LuxR family maltose regulon positive regulatory protein